MALINAISFVQTASINKELRLLCASLSKEKLLEHLNFNEIEFDDAINMELVKCHTYEQTEKYQQLRLWFLIL